MDDFKKIRGTIETYFRFGLGKAQIKGASSSALDARNDADGAYANVRVATPLIGDDAVNMTYADGTTFRRTFLLMGG